jgi:hypothetical protein
MRLLRNFVLLCCFFVTPLVADIVYPARLEVTESDSGRAQIRFTMPLVNGRLAPVRPLMPNAFSTMRLRADDRLAASRIMLWEANLKADSLFGGVIRLAGLEKTIIDVKLDIRLHNGRNYSALLRPQQPFFVIPAKPGWNTLAWHPLWSGLRAEGRNILLYLIILALVVFTANREKQRHLGLFFLFYSFSWLLQSAGLLLLPRFLSELVLVALLLFHAYQASRYAKYQIPSAIALFTGISAGIFLSVEPQVLDISKAFIPLEQWQVRLAALLGRLIHIFIFAAFAHMLFHLLKYWGISHGSHRVLIAVMAFAGVFYFVYQILPGLNAWQWGDLPFSFYVIAFFAGSLLHWRNSIMKWHFYAGMLVLFTLGLGMSAGLTEPLAGNFFILLPAALLLFAAAQRKPLSALFFYSLLGVLTFALALQIGYDIHDKQVMVTAKTGEAMLLFTFLTSVALLIGPFTSRQQKPDKFIFSAGFAIVILLQLFLLAAWVESVGLAALARGDIPVPLVSLALLGLGILLFSRPSQLSRELIGKRFFSQHHYAFLAAFFSLQAFILYVPGPSAGQQPQGEMARALLQQLLHDTYMAFNSTTDEALFEQLDANVSPELLSNLFLDGKRRLQAGSRQGSEIRVRAVELHDFQVQTSTSAGGKAVYRGRWEVLSRVRHQQHTHHRRNSYNGILRLSRAQSQWKLSAIELLSEERRIVQGGSR